MDPEITDLTWHRILDPQQGISAVVAEVYGKIVGIAHFTFHPSTSSASPSCYLEDLFVDEDYRGRGCGRALIERVCAEAEGRSAARVYWQTKATNLTARRLYDAIAERSGFIVYRRQLAGGGRWPEQVRRGGSFLPPSRRNRRIAAWQ